MNISIHIPTNSADRHNNTCAYRWFKIRQRSGEDEKRSVNMVFDIVLDFEK